MTNIFTKTTDGNHGISIILCGDKYEVFAEMEDGRGGLEFWFKVGRYATLKMAKSKAEKAMKDHGLTVIFAAA